MFAESGNPTTSLTFLFFFFKLIEKQNLSDFSKITSVLCLKGPNKSHSSFLSSEPLMKTNESKNRGQNVIFIIKIELKNMV